MTNLPDVDALSLKSQIAQMIVVRASGFLFDHQIQYPQWEIPNQALAKLISEDGIGGVILVGGSAPEICVRTQYLQSLVKKNPQQIPLFIAADVEEGVGQRFEGATHFPPPMALSALKENPEKNLGIEYARAMGEITAKEAQAIGINWLLAPVVDVNNNPANPVINVRAFGQNPPEVMDLTSAFIRGANKYAVLTTAKHFPGHGDTSADSHLQTPILEHSRERFEMVEFPPFASAIKEGVDAVMSAHVFAPNLDAHTISTLSFPTLTDILRGQLGFTGLIVTDALMMAGVSAKFSPEEVAVQAILAGADVLLMPIDADKTMAAILAAVESGQISRERIKQSLRKIWVAKSKILSGQNSDFAFKNISAQDLAIAEHRKIAAEITTASIQIYLPNSLVGSISGLIPGSIPAPIKPAILPAILIDTNLIFVDDVLTCGEFLKSATTATLKTANRIIVDANSCSLFSQALSQKQDQNQDLNSDQNFSIFLQIFSRGNPFRGSADMFGQIDNLILQLIRHHNLKAIALYGSPFNLDRLLKILTPDIAWAFSYSQQPLAQAEVMNRLGIGSFS